MARDKRPKTRDLDKQPLVSGNSSDTPAPDGRVWCGLLQRQVFECPTEGTENCPSC